MRRTLLLSVLLVACGSAPSQVTPGAWTLTSRVALPTGAALMPDDPGNPGTAAAQGIAYAHGKVFALLANLANYRPAGPSMMSIHDARSLTPSGLVPLVKDGNRCTNAGFAIAAGDTILAACAGQISINAGQPTTDGAFVEFSAMEGAVQRITIVGGSPGSVLRVGDLFWLGDLESPSLLRAHATTGVVLNGVGAEPPIHICRTGYVSALADIQGRTFASCFNDDTVQEFDPLTGKAIGDPLATGDGPVRMASFPDRIAVVDSLAGTLSFILPTVPASTQKHAVLVAGEQGGNDVEGIAGDGQWAATANSGFGTLTVFDVTDGFKLVDAIDLKTTPDAPTNYPYGVAMGDGAFYVAIAGWSQPSELVRVSRSAQ